jgi:hypothetical protein
MIAGVHEKVNRCSSPVRAAVRKMVDKKWWEKNAAGSAGMGRVGRLRTRSRPAAELPLAEPFRTEYAGPHATGEHVLALWQFNPPEPEADASGNGHELTLRGAEFVEEGRFGGALRSYRGWPVEDQPHQARAKNSPNLTPAGAFTIELWIQPDDELREYPEAFWSIRSTSPMTTTNWCCCARQDPTRGNCA